MKNFDMLAVCKILAYQQGIFVPDELYKKLNSFAYSGYRTTSGIFVKFGGTLSKTEFDKSEFAGSFDYEMYMRMREWATAQIFKKSDLTAKHKDNSYLVMDYDSKGDLVINGQYRDKEGKVHKIKLEDVGIFEQGNYDDSEAVAIQAGGIRARASLCGSNCISGCRFCSFGTGAEHYKKGLLSKERLEEYIKPLIRRVVGQNITQLFITGGNPDLCDLENWTTYLKECIFEFKKQAISKGFDEKNLTVDVMLTPRGVNSYVYPKEIRKQEYKRYCELLKSYGVNTVSPNMELWEPGDLEKYCPSSGRGTSKAEIGQDGYLDFIDAAVETFGMFNVRSAIIVGLTSVESTKKAIDTLVDRGCLVTLSPFKAPEEYQTNPRYAGLGLSSKEPNVEDLIELSQYLRDSLDRKLKNLDSKQREICNSNLQNCLNPHNTHNTANLCMENFDRLESKAFEDGKDLTLVTNVSNLTPTKTV